ncbi:MAG: DUF1016 N-terminal domain-containing protein [Clostridiales bacterium]|nr:DUF1016 N-terminal domain-containing protein [Clostridiales bacterium]
MNIRKNIDYTDMYAALDSTMEKNLSQVELYYEIGRAVCQRTEKGAAVAAAAYLSEQYPDIQGFSPRNLRRMRVFYRTYEDQPALLSLALRLCWTQNVVILEADLTMELQAWYLKAVLQFGWSKAELMEKITTNAHEMIILTIDVETSDTVELEEDAQNIAGNSCHNGNEIPNLTRIIICWEELQKSGRRRSIMPCSIHTEKKTEKIIITSCTFVCNKSWIFDYL